MENDNPTNALPGADELQEQRLWLRKQVSTILILLIVVSGAFNVFVLYQLRVIRTDLKGIQPQVPAMNEMSKQMDDLARRFMEYGRSHPDFGPIMVHYGLISNTVPTTPVAAPTPAPKK